MHKGKRGVLFVFSGPSGVGKGTLKAKLFEEFADRIAYSVSATTRGPREGEVDGKDYFFISRQEFERRVKNNEFLEHAEFAGNCYGTPRAYVEKLLDSGMNVVLEIDVQGALQVMKSMPECVSVFILPPSFEELEHRLRGRGTASGWKPPSANCRMRRSTITRSSTAAISRPPIRACARYFSRARARPDAQSAMNPLHGDILEEENPICL